MEMQAYGEVAAAVSGPLSVLAITWLTNHYRRTEREAAEHRQDALAARVELARLRVEEVAQTTAKTAAVVQLSVGVVDRKLDDLHDQNVEAHRERVEIHALVNSQLSKALAEQLEAHRERLVSLREILALKTTLGAPPTTDDLSVIDELVQKITAQAQVLVERATAEVVGKGA